MSAQRTEGKRWQLDTLETTQAKEFGGGGAKVDTKHGTTKAGLP